LRAGVAFRNPDQTCQGERNERGLDENGVNDDAKGDVIAYLDYEEKHISLLGRTSTSSKEKFKTTPCGEGMFSGIARPSIKTAGRTDKPWPLTE